MDKLSETCGWLVHLLKWMSGNMFWESSIDTSKRNIEFQMIARDAKMAWILMFMMNSKVTSMFSHYDEEFYCSGFYDDGEFHSYIYEIQWRWISYSHLLLLTIMMVNLISMVSLNSHCDWVEHDVVILEYFVTLVHYFITLRCHKWSDHIPCIFYITSGNCFFGLL